MILAFIALPIAPLSAKQPQSTAETNPNKKLIPNGIYLYGQSPKPDQIGQEYLVFQAENGKLVGALYMPHSEFSCFQGQVSANQLQMIVDHPYEDSTNAYEIALETPDPIANQNQSLSQPLTLQGYHPIEEISDSDRGLLATCQSVMNN